MPTVGRRGSVVTEIFGALRHAQGKTADGRNKPTTQTLIAELLEAAANNPHDGVLVVIDEMGKFLEASALGSGDDVYFFQELAEAAARSEGRLVVIGILHQSFAQYAARLGIDTRDDWAKVQGRYIDLPRDSTLSRTQASYVLHDLFLNHGEEGFFKVPLLK